MPKTPLSKSLRTIARTLDSLSDRELDALAAGKGKLVFVADEPPSEKPETSDIAIEAVLQQLSACDDREQARKVLGDVTGKESLTAIARSQKIHVAKHDRREDIEKKIVEFVIGGRLRSEAIQTLNLKGASGPSNGSHESIP